MSLEFISEIELPKMWHQFPHSSWGPVPIIIMPVSVGLKDSLCPVFWSMHFIYTD